MQKLLVIGASGHLGQHLIRDLGEAFQVAGCYHDHRVEGGIHLDVTDERQVAAILEREDPRVIVLAAALSSVAACESNPEISAAINVGGARNVARHALGRKVVFFSSDAIFDGSREEFCEDDSAHRLTVYGRHKWEAETVLRTIPDHLILRTARLYGRERGNGKFIDHVRETLTQGRRIEAPLDTPGNPSFVEDVSRATLALLERRRTGTWHVAGPRVGSLYQTASVVAEVFGFDPDLITPVPRDHGSPVPRVASVLDTRKLAKEGLRVRSLREGLMTIRDGR